MFIDFRSAIDEAEFQGKAQLTSCLPKGSRSRRSLSFHGITSRIKTSGECPLEVANLLIVGGVLLLVLLFELSARLAGGLLL